MHIDARNDEDLQSASIRSGNPLRMTLAASMKLYYNVISLKKKTKNGVQCAT